MEVLFLRHGEVASTPGIHPADTGLSPVGRRQAAAVAHSLRLLSTVPDLVIVSPLLRATQTAEVLLNILSLPPCKISESLAPGADPQLLFGLLSGLASKRILLVGHEPNLKDFASIAIAGSRNLRMRVPYAALLGIEFGMPVETRKGVLRYLLTSEHSMLMAGAAMSSGG